MMKAEDLDTNLFRKILLQNLNVQDEQVLIIGERRDNSVAGLLTEKYKEAIESLGLKFETLYKSPTPYGEVDNELGKVIKSLPDSSVIIVNVSEKMGRMDELLSFRKYCKQHSHRFASSSNLSTLGEQHLPYIVRVYEVDYKEMMQKSEMLRGLLEGAHEIRVTTPAGTDISMDVTGMKPIVNSGIYRNPGEGGNLPAGEVYMPPTLFGVNGTMVIDGSYRVKEGSRLISDPITLKIEQSNILSVEGSREAKELQETLEWARRSSKSPHALKICEFGIGINDQAKIIGCTVIDEKSLGTCHFAIGSNAWFGGPIKSKIHLDQVMRNPTILIDDKRVVL